MLKKIEFKFSKLKYLGKSIGNDIRVNIEILDKSIVFEKKITVNKTVLPGLVIGDFVTDQKYFTVITKVTITENDIIFNDTGSFQKSIKIDTDKLGLQEFVIAIEIHENRFGKKWGKAIAIFEATVQVLALEMDKYIPDVSNGWLKVRILNGDIVALPAFLKVRPEYIENGREYFTILEGLYNGQKASVISDNNKSILLTGIKLEAPAYLQYSISKKALVINGKKYQATDHPESPWKKGRYDIELPDYPHSGGQYYIDRSTRAKTWFRLGHSGDRYLHTGSRSLGCITITDVEKWGEVYNKLIKARKGDFLSVGVLDVID